MSVSRALNLEDPWRLVRGRQPEPARTCACGSRERSSNNKFSLCLQCGLTVKHDLLSSESQFLELDETFLSGLPSPRGPESALPGAIAKNVSFPLPREPPHRQERAPSFALNEWLHHQSVGNDVLNIRLPLVYEVLILLFASYLGNNAVKSFANINKMREAALRRKLCAFANRHYSEAITALRMHISVLGDYDVSVALKALALLNKCSIYEFENSLHSITFGQGMLSIHCDALGRYEHLDHQVRHTFGYMNLVSQLIHFPCYTPEVLVEFQSYLKRYSQFVTVDDISSDWIVQHFNQIWYYVKDVIQITANKDIEVVKTDSQLIYKLLRRWLLMLPPKIHILTSLGHPMERVLMLLYKTLTSILNNVFPSAMFMYLLSFNGGLTLWYDTHHTIPKETDLTCNILQSIERYCFRVNSFFKTRANQLAVTFGPLPGGKGISPLDVRSEINEIMIHDFTNSLLRLYNFIHLPLKSKPTATPDMFHNLQRMGNPYTYNREHFELLKAYMGDSTKGFQTSDPLLRFHLSNTTDYKLQDDDGPPIDYKLWLSEDENEHYLVRLNQEYSELFKKGFPVPRDSTKLDWRTGLYMDDSKPFSLISEAALQSLLAGVSSPLHWPESVFQVVPQTMEMRKGMLTRAMEEDDNDSQFYNAMRDKFYRAEQNYV